MELHVMNCFDPTRDVQQEFSCSSTEIKVFEVIRAITMHWYMDVGQNSNSAIMFRLLIFPAVWRAYLGNC
jgi:hypothetical protein